MRIDVRCKIPSVRLEPFPRRASASMYLSINSGSAAGVTYLSLPTTNPSARTVSSEILCRRRGAFFGFVLVACSFKNWATSLRISSEFAGIYSPDGLLSFFSLEPSFKVALLA